MGIRTDNKTLFGSKVDTDLISIKEVENMVHADDLDRVRKAWIDLIKGKKEYDIKYRIKSGKNDDYLYVQVNSRKGIG